MQPHACDIAFRAARGRASLYPGYWLNSSESMLLVVASGRFSTNRMLFGGASPVALTPACDASSKRPRFYSTGLPYCHSLLHKTVNALRAAVRMMSSDEKRQALIHCAGLCQEPMFLVRQKSLPQPTQSVPRKVGALQTHSHT